MSINLTENAIPAIINGDVDAKPLVQVVGVTLLVSSDDSLLRKYHLKLSDGVYSHPATIAAQLNDGVGTGRVKEGSIVQLLDYVCPTIVTQKIIIVHNMETIVLDSQIIGNPKSFVDSELPTVENEETSVIPIADLHPYKGRWAIKARVTSKGYLRHYNSPEGYAKAFSFVVLDSDGGEIQVTCLNDVIDTFYEAIEVGKVYLISKGGLIPASKDLKPASKDLKQLKIDWEIMLNSNSTVELCPDEDGSIPMHKFSFRSINDIENVESNTIVDVIGVVTSVNSSVLMSRENVLEMSKRILNLKDNSGRSVELTLWGELCNREGQELKDIVDAGGFPVLAVKAGKVNEFRGKSINTIPSTRLFVNPDFPEAQSLRLWFDQDGKDSASSSISKDISYGGPKNELRKTVSQIKDEGLGSTDKPDWMNLGDEVLPRVAQGAAISNKVYVNGDIDAYRAGFNAGLNAVPYEGVYEKGRGMHDGLVAGQLAQDQEDNEDVNLEAPIAQIAHEVGAIQAQEVRVAQGAAISNKVYVNSDIDSYRAGFNAGLNAVPYEGVFEKGRGMHDGLLAGQLAHDEEDNEDVNLEAPIAQIAHEVGAIQAQEVRVAQGAAISNKVYVNGDIDSYRAGFNAGLNAVPYEGVYEKGRGMHDGLVAGQLAQDEKDNEDVNLEAPIAQIAHEVGAIQAQEVAENLEADENAQVDIEVEQAEEVAQNLEAEQAEEEVPPQDEV